MRDYSCLDGEVVGMDAVSASERVGPNYLDSDNFYPANGYGQDDPEAVDISFDESENDLSPSSDYFDGDASSYFDGDSSSYFDGDGLSSFDGDDFASLDGLDEWSNGSGKERRAERKAKREDAAAERKGKREEAAADRKAGREERQTERRELRSERKKAKTAEIEARNKLTESLSQPDQTADLLKSMQETGDQKSTEKKGMSTTTIVLIAVGGLAVLGATAFFLLRKKK
jgi:hypothetical protein